jgi:hypothetical protein
LAILAVIGFFIAIPLQTYDRWTQQRSAEAEQASQLTRSGARFASLRQAVDGASSVDGLERRLAALRGPSLSPGDRQQPIGEIKARLHQDLDRAQDEKTLEIRSRAVPSLLQVIYESVLNGLASLALAFGFAALSKRPGSDFSLLREWQNRWAGSRSLTERRPSAGL